MFCRLDENGVTCIKTRGWAACWIGRDSPEFRRGIRSHNGRAKGWRVALCCPVREQPMESKPGILLGAGVGFGNRFERKGRSARELDISSEQGNGLKGLYPTQGLLAGEEHLENDWQLHLALAQIRYGNGHLFTQIPRKLDDSGFSRA